MPEFNRLQLIGLPGSGKTTALQLLRSESKFSCLSFFDIRSYAHLPFKKQHKIQQDINLISGPTLVESACGLYVPKSIVIRLEVPTPTLYERLRLRDGFVDCDYISFLREQMIPHQYTITSSGDLPLLVKLLLELGD